MELINLSALYGFFVSFTTFLVLLWRKPSFVTQTTDDVVKIDYIKVIFVSFLMWSFISLSSFILLYKGGNSEETNTETNENKGETEESSESVHEYR